MIDPVRATFSQRVYGSFCVFNESGLGVSVAIPQCVKKPMASLGFTAEIARLIAPGAWCDGQVVHHHDISPLVGGPLPGIARRQHSYSQIHRIGCRAKGLLRQPA